MQINFRELTIDDIVSLLNETGYITERREFEFARENDLFKFIGVTDRAAKYLIAFEDDNDEDAMYATIVFVFIGPNGKLNADWAGAPCFETTMFSSLQQYFNNRCN